MAYIWSASVNEILVYFFGLILLSFSERSLKLLTFMLSMNSWAFNGFHFLIFWKFLKLWLFVESIFSSLIGWVGSMLTRNGERTSENSLQKSKILIFTNAFYKFLVTDSIIYYACISTCQITFFIVTYF